MPEVSRPLDGDQFHEMAHAIYKLLTKGTGTAHANVRLTRDALNQLATANYKNGFKDGYGEGAKAQATAVRENEPALQAAEVPQPAGMYSFGASRSPILPRSSTRSRSSGSRWPSSTATKPRWRPLEDSDMGQP